MQCGQSYISVALGLLLHFAPALLEVPPHDLGLDEKRGDDPVRPQEVGRCVGEGVGVRRCVRKLYFGLFNIGDVTLSKSTYE